MAAILPLALLGLAVSPAAPAGASSGGTVTYTANLNIPAPPTSNFAGATSGDGWNVALTPTAVYNVFHHQEYLGVDCHLQANAAQTAPCWGGSVTITDTDGSAFYTSGQPTVFLDQSTGYLYVFVTHPEDDTAGVACINTNATLPASNLFCGYQPLTPEGEGPPTSSGISGVSDAVQVGSNMYAFNYVNTSTPVGAEDQLLCFSMTTWSACAGQPYAVDTSLSGMSVSPEPSPSISALNNQIIDIPVADGGTTTLACYEPSVSGGSCGGSWPVATGIDDEGNYGPAFPLLDASAETIGFCLPTGTDPCWTLSGASTTTPSGMSSALPANTEWNGPAVTVGPRVYLPDQNTIKVNCFDYSTDAACTNFPKSFSGINNGPYTVNLDPQRPTCIWINSDSGSSQIQNFDAFTGGPCGQGPITLEASDFVAPPEECTPTEWTNLQITSPSPPSVYGGGSVEFENSDGGELSGIGGSNPVDLDSTGSVDLTPYNFSAASNLPDFALTLNSPPSDLTSVTILVSWQASGGSACTEPGTSVSGSVSLAGPGTSVPINTSQTISATVTSNGEPVSGATVTFTCVAGPCTTATGTATTDPSGVATLTYSSTIAGTDIWQASYTPSGEQTETSDAAVVWDFIATATPSQTSYGNTVMLGESGLPATATGTVTFSSGGNTLCTLTLTGLAGEATSCTTDVLALGSYSVVAAYSGDANNPPSSAKTSFAIGQQSTTTVAGITDTATGEAWSNSELPGAVAYDTAAVSNNASGTVTYNLYSGDNCLGTLLETSTEDVVSGVADPSAQTSPLGAGNYSYQAVFDGSTDYDTSAGSCQPFVVEKAGSSESLQAVDASASSVWANPEDLGTVASASAGLPSSPDINESAPVPSGTVTYSFYDNATCDGPAAATSPTPIEDGAVADAPVTAALAPGSYSYDATYSGDSNYEGSTSSCVLLTVEKATPTVGVTPLNAANGDGLAGTEVTGLSVYATSSVSGVEGFTPTSTVTYNFYESAECTGTPLASSSGSLADGVPADSADTAALAAGDYYVEASYSGDSDYYSASSSCVPITVNRAQPTLSDQVDVVSNSSKTGSQAYDTATLSGVEGFTDTGTVTYSFYDNPTCEGDVEGQTVTLVDGNVPNSATTPPLPAGTYSYQAAYSGDSNYLPATGTCLTFSLGLGLPTVSQQVDDAATHSGWSGHETLGASAVDTATVTGVGGFTPTGDVIYEFFDNGTCSGTPASTDEVDLAENGSVPNSSATGKLAAGTYGFESVYDGDVNYGAISSGCESFSVLPAASVTGGSVKDAATHSAWSGSEVQGASAYDTSTVSGVAGVTPTGTVTYSLYDDSSCSGRAMTTQTVRLVGGKVPNSSRTEELAPGHYSYRAAYGGNSQYRPSSSGCKAFSAAAVGYRLEGGDGGVFDFDSHFFGSVPRLGLHIYNFVGMAATADGYWLVESNGGIYAFGSAHGYGTPSSRGIHVNDIVGIAATADGKGYFEVASNGAVYAFGDAVSHGSLSSKGIHVNDIVAIDSPDSGGYWLLGSNGRVYPFGNAKNHGSCATAGSACHGLTDIVAIASPDAGGYLLVTSNGRVFAFGDAKSHGACTTAGSACHGVKDIVGIATPGFDQGGYWLAGANGTLYAFGDAKNFGNETEAATGARLTRPIVAITG